MGVFISYSNTDSHFVFRLAAELIKNRVPIWLDKLEMKPGDSLIEKVQEGLDNSDFLIVVLSKKSVDSEWCKKELNSILISEINEKRNRIIPVLIENCKIPFFLQDRLYANFKEDFALGFGELLRSLAEVINDKTGRGEADGAIVDFGQNWGIEDGTYVLNLEFVIWIAAKQKSVILQVQCVGNNIVTSRFHKQVSEGMGFLMKESLILFICENEELKRLLIVVGNGQPFLKVLQLKDPNLGLAFDIKIRAVVLGVDNGDDLVLNFLDYIDILEADRQLRRNMHAGN